MKSSSLFLGTLLSACLLFAGCATPPKVDGVTVTVVGFRTDESSSVQTQAIMTLRFSSESVNPVAITSTSHELFFAKHYVGKAENPVAIGLPPMGTMTQDVIFHLEHPAVVRQVLSVTSQAPYRLESTLFFSEGDNKRRHKVNAEGKVELNGLEHAAR